MDIQNISGIFEGLGIRYVHSKISIKNYRGVFAKKGRGKGILFDKKNPREFQQFACNLFLRCLKYISMQILCYCRLSYSGRSSSLREIV